MPKMDHLGRKEQIHTRLPHPHLWGPADLLAHLLSTTCNAIPFNTTIPILRISPEHTFDAVLCLYWEKMGFDLS